MTDNFINTNQILDVAIIGAGISGTYVSWRLINSATENYRKIHLYELSDRIGGRLFSMAMPGMPHVLAELGGMTFSESQTIVWQLAKILKLNVVPFKNQDQNSLLFLRNQHFCIKDFANPVKIPYNLNSFEQGKSPDELFHSVIKSILPQKISLLPIKNNPTYNEWQQIREICQVEGEHLYDLSLSQLLGKLLSQEAYNLIMEGGFSEADFSKWNAAEAIAMSLYYLSSSKWYTIEDGCEQLPKTLATRFEQKGGQIFFDHRLIKFNFHQSDQLIELRFVNEAGESQPPIFTKHLVLALPKSALDSLSQQNQNHFFFNHSTLHNNLSTINPNPAYKLFLGYDFPWWRTVTQESSSITDLPIRRCFYFGTECEQREGEANNHRSLLLANYPNLQVADFWHSLTYDPKKPNKNPIFEGTLSTSQLQYFFSQGNQISPQLASKNMVETAQQQLKKLHDLEDILEPYIAIYMDWNQEPYGGGWHTWNPGCKPWKIIPQMRKPVKETNIYICGEAYSNVQGWMQGALNSAEKMLEENFGLERPEWLPTNYNLGP